MFPLYRSLALAIPFLTLALTLATQSQAQVISQSDNSCLNPEPGTCDFYAACLDTAWPCGTEGYAIGYGEKYCERFRDIDSFSPRGAAWRDATMLCLQRALAPFVSETVEQAICRDITDYAFDSHPACYTQQGASICDLGIPDVKRIVTTIEGQDLWSQRGRKQVVKVARICVDTLRGRISHRSQGYTRSVETNQTDLRERLSYWDSLSSQ